MCRCHWTSPQFLTMKVRDQFSCPKKLINDSNLFRVATGVRKIIDYQFFSPYYRLIIDFSILYRLILSTSIFRIFCPEIDLEPDSQPNQTFILRSLLISECGMTKKLKWGSVYMFITNLLYLVVHIDGYVQRIFKTFKIID